MKNVRTILAVVSCMALTPVLSAQETKAHSPLVSISKEAKGKLKTGAMIAIFLSGNDTLLTRIVEDALAIHLTNESFVVIDREKLEKSVGEQIAKRRKEKESGSVNAFEVGKAVKADYIVTGTVIIESVEQGALLVRIASFQLLDMEGEETMIRFFSEPEKGKSFSEITREFVNVLKQNMK